jgi:hypothetical protein
MFNLPSCSRQLTILLLQMGMECVLTTAENWVFAESCIFEDVFEVLQSTCDSFLLSGCVQLCDCGGA